MKLTRKRAVEKVLQIFEQSEWGLSIEEQAYLGVDYGIVLGLQMALTACRNQGNTWDWAVNVEKNMTKRLKKLEKQMNTNDLISLCYYCNAELPLGEMNRGYMGYGEDNGPDYYYCDKCADKE